MANTLQIGSQAHKELLCRTFIDTHDPFVPSRIQWPDLDPASLQRLKDMPVWNEATRTEAATAVKVQSLGDTEKDPLLAEAISLQGYEEGRHAEVLQLLTRHYGIPVAPFPPPEVPKDPTLAFLRTGYGECLDSFFAFGLFRLGERAEVFPRSLISHLRDDHAGGGPAHPLHRQLGGVPAGPAAAGAAARRSTPGGAGTSPRRPSTVSRARSRWPAAATRKRTGYGNGEKAEAAPTRDEAQDGFTLKSHSMFGDFSLRSFLETCLQENDRRLAPYDPRLLRPRLVPSVVRQVVKVLPRKSPREANREEKVA